MRRQSLILAFALLLLAALADAAERRFELILPEIDKLRVASGIPSISIAVAQRGRIVWETGLGWADREQRIPATEHTVYALASISKPITATGLMTLVQAGRIELDAPVNDYLGNAKVVARVGNAREATLRRVANHTSGLPIHSQFFFADEPYAVPSLDETILRYGNLVTAPGERFQYSNLGYGILGEIIERVSGETYAQYMRQHVFQKLGMTRTSVGCTPELEQLCAARYDETGARIPRFVLDTPAAGGIVASAHDLARFGMFHLKDRLADQAAILTDASLDAMHRATSQDSSRGYGIGWEDLQTGGGYRVLSHRGGMPGAATLLQLIPEEDVALVVLANGPGEEGLYKSQVWAIADLIMKAVLVDWSPVVRVSAGQMTQSEPTTQLHGQWQGFLHTYRKGLPVALTVSAAGEIQMRIADQLPSLLSDVSFKGGWLRGLTRGDLGTEEVDRHHHKYLTLLLKQRGEVLTGSVAASTDDARGFELAHWVELRKQ